MNNIPKRNKPYLNGVTYRKNKTEKTFQSKAAMAGIFEKIEKIWTVRDGMERDRTRWDETRPDRTGQDRTGQDRSGRDGMGRDGTGQDRTRQDMT